MDLLHQQALAETGAGIGLVILQIGAVGLGVVAVHHAQGNVAAVGNTGCVAATDRFAEHTLQRRPRRGGGGNRAAGQKNSC
ncbi:hypothetical protein D3C86_1878280 [compost metagenome]